MTTSPAEPTPEQRLALLLRGVQRMADALGGVDERLQGLAGRVDENRVRSRAELAQVGERVDRLTHDVAKSLEVATALGHAVEAALKHAPAIQPPAPTNELAVEHLTEAVRALRDDLATAWGQLREQTADAVDRVAGDQAERTLRLLENVADTRQQVLDALQSLPPPAESSGDAEAIAALKETLDGRHVVVTQAIQSLQQQLTAAVAALKVEVGERFEALPAPAAAADDAAVRAALADVRDELRCLQGEVVDGAGQLRTDLGARQSQLRGDVLMALEERLARIELPAPTLDPILDRLAVLDARIGQPVDLAPVLERLAQLEARLAEPVPIELDPVVSRLAAIEARIAPPADLGPLAERLALLDARIGDAPVLEPVDLTPVVERLAALESRLDAPTEAATGVDLSPVLERLAGIDARLADPTPTTDLEPVRERLAAIEWRLGEVLDPLKDRLAGVEWRIGEALAASPQDDRGDDLLGRLATIEASLASLRRDLSVELESVAADTRRGVDRIVGEVRSVDERVGGMADDLRVVRHLRDGLQDLLDGVDATRQLAARAATSQQMSEVTRELGSVLAEIEAARSQVLRVEQSPQPHQAHVVDVDVDRLGQRIEQLAEAIEERMVADPPATKQEGEAAQQVIGRLRNLGSGARQLGNGILDDVRSRRKR